jgi:hypothetical protein
MSRKKSKRKKDKQSPAHEHRIGDHEMSDKPQNVYVRGTIETTIHPDLVKKYDTGQNKQDSREGIKLKIEIVTLIVVFVYTTVAFWQGCSAKKSAKAAQDATSVARDAITISARPWVGPEKGAIVKITENKTETLLVIRSYGQSPALRIGYAMKPLNLDVAMRNSKSKSDMYCKAAESFTVQEKYFKSPEEEPIFTGGTLFPNGAPMTLHDIEYLNGPIKGFFAVMGCVTYVDQFYGSSVNSTIHHTRFCFLYGPELPELPTPTTLEVATTCNFGQGAD